MRRRRRRKKNKVRSTPNGSDKYTLHFPLLSNYPFCSSLNSFLNGYIQRVEWSKIDAFYPLQHYAAQSVICVVNLKICLLNHKT